MSLGWERRGHGRPVVLLHGTGASRRLWDPVLERLPAEVATLAVDLPGHGESPATSTTPAGWARVVRALLEAERIELPAVVGHSSGGWTALELAKLGAVREALALTPAGLWRRRSPLLTDVRLVGGFAASKLGRPVAPAVVRTRIGRRVGLAALSARPADVPADVALAAARDTAPAGPFLRHFRDTRTQRFTGGRDIDVPVTIVWGAEDRLVTPRARHLDQLPPHVHVELWEDCGHAVLWDAPDRVAAAIERVAARGPAPSRV